MFYGHGISVSHITNTSNPKENKIIYSHCNAIIVKKLLVVVNLLQTFSVNTALNQPEIQFIKSPFRMTVIGFLNDITRTYC